MKFEIFCCCWKCCWFKKSTVGLSCDKLLIWMAAFKLCSCINDALELWWWWLEFRIDACACSFTMTMAGALSWAASFSCWKLPWFWSRLRCRSKSAVLFELDPSAALACKRFIGLCTSWKCCTKFGLPLNRIKLVCGCWCGNWKSLKLCCCCKLISWLFESVKALGWVRFALGLKCKYVYEYWLQKSISFEIISSFL